ncbi:short chain dehydrogenase [Oleiphilus messinensis]|uniref:Short chain dehydrogenase n=1 Tax=Oleiphilus messinensis TaxID=141451 RepID=A0A1Y0I7P1_9GAMM|nr:alpha/beta fold hydrolase [Oleiphilus messinensis]ARU55525.1 short chain dehydrogenase [Oleiphilus messinensis]
MKELLVKSYDVELSVQVYGSAKKPTLLFLHGFPDCHKTWDHQVEALQKHYQVVTFDMRGVGGSTWSARRNAYKMNNMLADIEAVINAVVGKDGQVHLIGHDWGSVIGWSFITERYYARRILSYTSMSGPHLGLMLDWVRRSLLSGKPKKVASALKQGIFSWYVYLFNLPVIPEMLFKSLGPVIWKTALTRNGVDPDDAYLQQSSADIKSVFLNPVNLYRQNPLDPPPLPAKGGIQMPVQLLIPTGDSFISDQLFEFYDEYVPQLTRRVIDGKHWAHHSHKDDFNQYVREFVERVQGTQKSRAA